MAKKKEYTIDNWRKEVDSFLELADKYAEHIKITEITATIYGTLAYWCKKYER